MLVLVQYQQALVATLGAITAHTLVSSRESSRVIRECSKALDDMSVELRKQLLANEKLMVINNDPTN
jgi:hypothetical protein